MRGEPAYGQTYQQKESDNMPTETALHQTDKEMHRTNKSMHGAKPEANGENMERTQTNNTTKLRTRTSGEMDNQSKQTGSKVKGSVETKSTRQPIYWLEEGEETRNNDNRSTETQPGIENDNKSCFWQDRRRTMRREKTKLTMGEEQTLRTA